MKNKILFVLCFLPIIYLWTILRIVKGNTKRLPKLNRLIRDLWILGIDI